MTNSSYQVGHSPRNAHVGRAKSHGVKEVRPVLYLAGKIGKNCWRHRIVPELRRYSWDHGLINHENFVYSGPYFSGCDHGCLHGPSTHGQMQRGANGLCPSANAWEEFTFERQEILDLCLSAIQRSDTVFAYINATDCFGTLVELGIAIAWGKRVVVAFAPSIASSTQNDFWFVCTRAAVVRYEVTEEQLPALFDSTIGRAV